MTQNTKINPQDIAAYIVFQFNGLESTLTSYNFTEIAQALNVLKYTFIRQALSQENNTQIKNKNN